MIIYPLLTISILILAFSNRNYRRVRSIALHIAMAVFFFVQSILISISVTDLLPHRISLTITDFVRIPALLIILIISWVTAIDNQTLFLSEEELKQYKEEKKKKSIISFLLKG